jgi:hypothetical protein
MPLLRRSGFRLCYRSATCQIADFAVKKPIIHSILLEEGKYTAEKEKKMKHRRGTLFSGVLPGLFVSGLLFTAIFSGRAYAIITIVDDNVVAVRGWDMGSCTVPMGPNSTAAIYFKDGEIINMPIHINKQNDHPDVADIFISGSPAFMQSVKMGESRYTSDGNDKYVAVMSCFQNGIYFDVPDSKISDEAAVQKTIDRYRDSTLTAYRFTPNAIASGVSSPKCSAVQLEFYVKNGVGMVRIDPNCTVKLTSPGSFDYNIVSGSNPMSFQQYYIYAYHYKKNADPYIVVPITDTYVTQTIGGYTSDPGGQIYVKGNVVIGGGEDANFTDINNMVVNGKITVVATGNIWVADSIRVDGDHDVNDMPTNDNPNFLGLIAQGVIKVVDPGLSYLHPNVVNYTYRPIGITKPGNTGRYLPDPTVVEAAITVGGGGWGAENVSSRTAYSGTYDDLYVRGAISEVFRGVVGVFNSSTGQTTNGYNKHYYYDERLSPVVLVCSEAIPGDLNGDCIVDFEDVAIMAVHWLESNLSGDPPMDCTSPIEGDVNNDCTVDFVDLAIMAGHWLECNLGP